MIQLATLYKRGHIKNKESRFLTFIDCVRTRENCPQCLFTRHCSDHWLIVYFIIPIFGVSSDPKRSPRWPVKRHEPFPSFLPPLSSPLLSSPPLPSCKKYPPRVLFKLPFFFWYSFFTRLLFSSFPFFLRASKLVSQKSIIHIQLI